MDSTSRHIQRLAYANWVVFTSCSHFIFSRGIFLGEATNIFSEYNIVIKLLPDALSRGIYCLWVYLDAQLVMSWLNGFYHIYDPTLHQRFLRVCLLEFYFDYITYIHIPKRYNQLTDTLANSVLDWHVAHT